MTHTNSESEIEVGIAQADNDEQLMMVVSSASKCDVHKLTLAQARELSLELIKQTYRAELRSRLSEPETRATRRCASAASTSVT
ncbi:MAG: hypothetical protein Q8O33_18085 [Pseudomonadota bacterium]|nr:hypothetical protein [Pseudomonadota bacterium]